MSSITLYALDGCSYCETAHDALDSVGVEYVIEWVEPLRSKRDEVKHVSGQRGVPVLVDEEWGVTTAGRDNIVEYVETSLAGRADG